MTTCVQARRPRRALAAPAPRLAPGTYPPERDLCLIDREPAAPRGLKAGGVSGDAVNVGDGAAPAAHEVVVVGLEGEVTDAVARRAGYLVGPQVVPGTHRAQDRQPRRRHP